MSRSSSKSEHYRRLHKTVQLNSSVTNFHIFILILSFPLVSHCCLRNGLIWFKTVRVCNTPTTHSPLKHILLQRSTQHTLLIYQMCKCYNTYSDMVILTPGICVRHFGCASVWKAASEAAAIDIKEKTSNQKFINLLLYFLIALSSEYLIHVPSIVIHYWHYDYLLLFCRWYHIVTG